MDEGLPDAGHHEGGHLPIGLTRRHFPQALDQFLMEPRAEMRVGAGQLKEQGRRQKLAYGILAHDERAGRGCSEQRLRVEAVAGSIGRQHLGAVQLMDQPLEDNVKVLRRLVAAQDRGSLGPYRQIGRGTDLLALSIAQAVERRGRET